MRSCRPDVGPLDCLQSLFRDGRRYLGRLRTPSRDTHADDGIPGLQSRDDQHEASRDHHGVIGGFHLVPEPCPPILLLFGSVDVDQARCRLILEGAAGLSGRRWYGGSLGRLWRKVYLLRSRLAWVGRAALSRLRLEADAAESAAGTSDVSQRETSYIPSPWSGAEPPASNWRPN